VIDVLLVILVALPAALGYIMLVLTSSITHRSGHRSNAVQIYKRPCVEQQKAVSSALDVPDIASTSVDACVKSEDGKVGPLDSAQLNSAHLSSPHLDSVHLNSARLI